MTGKVADTVMSVRNGVQVVRKYQPVVMNPKSEAQVGARARLKLMSQLAAVMAPVIAIPRDGAVTARNIFVKKNYPLSSYSEMQADIELPLVQLTKSVVAFPAPSFQRTTGDNPAIAVSLASPVLSTAVSRVVYCLFDKQPDGKLRFVASNVSREGGPQNYWPATLPAMNDAGVILAYGVRLNSDAARTTFGELEVETAETIAKLVVSRTLLESDITMTETRGVNVPVVTP